MHRDAELTTVSGFSGKLAIFSPEDTDARPHYTGFSTYINPNHNYAMSLVVFLSM